MFNVSHFYNSTLRSMFEVPNIAVFCSFLTSRLSGMFFSHFLNDLEMVPVAPVISGITFVCTCYIRSISNVRTLYFKVFSSSFLITFLSIETAASVEDFTFLSLV